MPLTIIDHPSPNHGLRTGAGIRYLVIHYTGMKSAAAALERLCDPAAQVSAHYLIDETGKTFRLVPEERRAWHAGKSFWRGERDLNSLSVGIELANPGHDHDYRSFPPAQMDALKELATGLVARHRIAPAGVLGHSDIAPGRKIDPGELFDWKGLAELGLGLWPSSRQAATLDMTEALDALSRIGYAVPLSPELGADLIAGAVDAISAFQRHYRPQRFDGVFDSETASRIAALAALTTSATA